MLNDQELKKEKAKKLRYKKAIAKHLNLEYIKQQLWDIQDECEEIRWYTDSEDGEETLINELSGDEDEAYEFKMAFADLCAECERMYYDLQEEWVPKCFDIFFAATSKDDLLGWDSYEGDYFGIEYTQYAEEESAQKLKKMTKDELIESSRQCMRIFQSYIGLQNRYDSLKAAIDILKEQNTGYLQVIGEIERLYQEANSKQGIYAEYSKEWKEFDRFADALPQEAWIQ